MSLLLFSRYSPITFNMHILGDLTLDEFLSEYWQKKPVLIRSAFPDFAPLLSAQELAGLSLEEEIESRIILEKGGKAGEIPWELRKGPFTEEDYRSLPESHWTLLVQAVDHWLPEAADLLKAFRFIPSWRIDDLMVSYATDGGSVGPHYDQYDVFLLQAEGQREWRIGQLCSEQDARLEGTPLSILEQFNETDSWVLNPGDMLYIPPKVAHWGTAKGECMTYSIGFRAPSTAQLLERSLDELLTRLTDEQRYADADLKQQDSHSEITPDAIHRLKNLLIQQFDNPTLLTSALGKLMTEPKYPDDAPELEELCVSDSSELDLKWHELTEELSEQDQLTKHEHARFAYAIEGKLIQFFYQGENRMLPIEDLALVKLISDHRHIPTTQLLDASLSPQTKNLVLELWQSCLLI